MVEQQEKSELGQYTQMVKRFCKHQTKKHNSPRRWPGGKSKYRRKQ